ncbi:rhiD polyketide synthase, rhizoxin biosynthesis domain protein [Burkholderia gladioli]|uniref:RhiD polyketide synthase, rhizoxin biosynthesis domain protein n=1 Tax=Burkholderia gladioli TaxID=28095 RepID=A0AAW3EZ81_BURGA|nr:rhiD polyketide synthase, rhizoxin biosynthesis domain protein [Burkholderia gladioli]
MRRAVMDSAGVEPGITGLAAPPGFHPRQQLAQIERAGDVRLVHRRRIALAVHGTHALHLAIDLVAHRPRAARLQPDAHLQRPRAVMHQRLGPGHVRERHGRCRAAVGQRQRGLHRRTRHLQIGHARQHPRPAHPVIRQEPLAAVQPGVETLSIQRRAVLVQQRMARRPGSHARLRGDLPVMPTHERITGQRRDAHAPSRIEALPVELDALGPGLEQTRVLALVEPAVERARRVLVSGEHGQRAVMRADIALVAPALGCLAAGKAFEFVDRFVDRAGHEGEPMLERLATGLQGEGDLAERRVAMIAPPQGGEQALRSLSQRRLLAGGQDDRHRLTRIGLVVLARIEVLLHDQVRVRTARPERRDASQSWQLALDARRRRTRTRPPGQLALDPERRGAEVDQRVGVVGMQARRQLAVTHLQQHLGQSGDAGRAFGMADVRLHRADRAGQGPLVRLPRSLGEGLGEPRDLDRIAQCGARAVRLEIGDGR